MSTTLKSLIALLLCAAMLCCTVSCKPEDADRPDNDAEQGTPDDTSDDTSDDTPTVDGLGIVVNGEAVYRVVRGDIDSVSVRTSMMTLIGSIEDATGVRLTPVTDYEPYDENVKEIIVGIKNNRPATEKIRLDESEESFCIRAVDGNIVLAGTSDAAVALAVEMFTKTYLAEPSTSLILPEDLSITMSLLEWQTENPDATVTLKTSYSDYIDDFDESELLPFDSTDEGFAVTEGGYIDEEHSIDGYGALRWDLQKAYPEFTRFVNCPAGSFSFDASDKNASTLKLWLYVSDTDAITCDHDAGYGIQKNQATFFFRALDASGRTHCWNHTITNPGWHEIELSFNIHNGADATFDYSKVSGFWVGFSTYGEVTVMLDQLRGVTYSTDYTPAEIEGETNARLISDAEYNALDGAILQEWYGASYDLEDKIQGASSLRNMGDGSVNDFRTIVANLDIEMDHSRDELVFHMKLAELSSVKSIFIELNEEQDRHEFEQSFTIAQLQSYGLSTENDTWSEVRIPLSAFRANLDAKRGDTVTLHNFRFVASANSGKTYDCHIDHIYLAEK